MCCDVNKSLGFNIGTKVKLTAFFRPSGLLLSMQFKKAATKKIISIHAAKEGVHVDTTWI